MQSRKSSVNVEKSQVMVVGREEVAPQVEVEINGEILEAASS